MLRSRFYDRYSRVAVIIRIIIRNNDLPDDAAGLWLETHVSRNNGKAGRTATRVIVYLHPGLKHQVITRSAAAYHRRRSRFVHAAVVAYRQIQLDVRIFAAGQVNLWRGIEAGDIKIDTVCGDRFGGIDRR